MNIFNNKKNVASSISHALINRQKGKLPEPIITIRQLEEKDIDEARQLLYDHFNSLTLPAVIYWSIQHIYDLLVIIIINYVFFLNLKKILYFLIIFLIYLYIRAKLEFLNHIRKDCPDLENLYKSYINVEGCNFWVAEVYDSNFSSASRTTCSDIHEKEKVLLEQEEQENLIHNEKESINEKDFDETKIIKKDISEKKFTCENSEASKEIEALVNNNINKELKNNSNTNYSETEEQQKNNNKTINNNQGENINGNQNDTANKINGIISNINNYINKNENNNIECEVNNPYTNNVLIDNEKNNNEDTNLNDDFVKDTNESLEIEDNNTLKINNNHSNFDNSNIKENNDNPLNSQDDENKKIINYENPTCKNDEDANNNIYNHMKNANNDNVDLKYHLKDKSLISFNEKKENDKSENIDNYGHINNNIKNDNHIDKNINSNNNNGHNMNELNILKNDNLNKKKNLILSDICDFSKQHIVNNKNIRYGFNEIKNKILNSNINEDEDFNTRYLNKKIVGCVGIVPYKGDNSIAQLVRMAVKQDNRRMRIGSRLLTQLENFAYEQKYQELKVFTNNLNTDSLYFVKQNGFNLSQIVRRGLMRGDLLIWSKILNKDDLYKFNSNDVKSYNILD